MRKTVIFDRPVRIMNPVWHVEETSSTSKYQVKYRRPMVILELIPGVEYKCEDLQKLINRGAVVPEEEYTYMCSHGFIPVTAGVLAPISEVSTGQDPVEELN